ncbi:MAG: SGNH/GDSL hydrolase family protein [Pegethrix bostrychoides GSE-TBD4-15B]|jgi:lysophospholipase L1-like esterase|uniref:SGNH/GDSL hydrolase family protein n=1 Tax=Pegethrix bostrychoides GSE-TBD4-15B TaxID=2839662 RepID=A0A951PBB7_9CYAN|nr:SGNH/GDSL hydrolase family protein [Pegethrix bostrychoides GSE-TBD4-15B]
MNHLWLIPAGIIAVLVGLELVLRLFGFGKPLLYQADSQIGYLIAPNQQTCRFGKQIAINRHSMRSPEIAAARPDQTLRVLMLGDSILNGGWWTDQGDTVSALLQQQLNSPSDRLVEVLNASANSWSPRNELAYLQRFGSFESQMIILMINTDDLFGVAPAAVVVGRDRNYPNRLPPAAIAEVVTRYVLPPQPIPELAALQAEAGDRVGFNLTAIRQIRDLARQNNAEFMLVMTPLLRELGSGSRDYELKARQRLQAFTQSEGILYIDFLPIFQALPDYRAIYHDHIHLNPAGNRQIVEQLIAKFPSL